MRRRRRIPSSLSCLYPQAARRVTQDRSCWASCALEVVSQSTSCSLSDTRLHVLGGHALSNQQESALSLVFTVVTTPSVVQATDENTWHRRTRTPQAWLTCPSSPIRPLTTPVPRINWVVLAVSMHLTRAQLPRPCSLPPLSLGFFNYVDMIICARCCGTCDETRKSR